MLPYLDIIEPCDHEELCLDTSPNAVVAGFKRPNARQRKVDATLEGRLGRRAWDGVTSEAMFDDPMTFPGPLVLPDDDLDIDPDYEPHSFKEWLNDDERNPVTQERKTIYIVPSPEITEEVSQMKQWRQFSAHNATLSPNTQQNVDLPDLEQFREYLAAFYYGMDIKISQQHFQWQIWDEPAPRKGLKKRPKKTKGNYDATPLGTDDERLIGLKTPTDELVGVRCRRSPDRVSPMQINLDDVLSALLENVPDDAYAVFMLLGEDIWEGDDDIFTGGRAYGASRIAVVSAFRDRQGAGLADEQHGWPLSHCAEFVEGECHYLGEDPPPGTSKNTNSKSSGRGVGPMLAAVQAVTTGSPRDGEQAWITGIAQTMAHELGHCFGMDHCVYFACMMQGSASSPEAYRQPPYLCPVCLEKVATSIGTALVDGWDGPDAKRLRSQYVRERYEALRAFCERFSGESGSRVFTGYEAWLGKVLEYVK